MCSHKDSARTSSCLNLKHKDSPSHWGPSSTSVVSLRCWLNPSIQFEWMSEYFTKTCVFTASDAHCTCRLSQAKTTKDLHSNNVHAVNLALCWLWLDVHATTWSSTDGQPTEDNWWLSFNQQYISPQLFWTESLRILFFGMTPWTFRKKTFFFFFFLEKYIHTHAAHTLTCKCARTHARTHPPTPPPTHTPNNVKWITKLRNTNGLPTFT